MISFENSIAFIFQSQNHNQYHNHRRRIAWKTLFEFFQLLKIKYKKKIIKVAPIKMKYIQNNPKLIQTFNYFLLKKKCSKIKIYKIKMN